MVWDALRCICDTGLTILSRGRETQCQARPEFGTGIVRHDIILVSGGRGAVEVLPVSCGGERVNGSNLPALRMEALGRASIISVSTL